MSDVNPDASVDLDDDKLPEEYPPEQPYGVNERLTAAEEEVGESLEDRTKRERPDHLGQDVGRVGTLVAPGGDETKIRDGYGVQLDAGSRIVMQVHYNLLQGASPDVSSTQLRWMKGSSDLTPLHTFLLPAPVELPCRPGHDDGPLCDRDAAVADVLSRFGSAGNTNSLLHLLCGDDVKPSNTTSCTRTVLRGMTVIGVAGHMHLLGRKISIEANPGTDRAKTILDIPVWDFDNQGTKPIEPLHLDAFDKVRVTCVHQQWLRDRLPAFQGQQERYVVWGEGSTDEMCLGMLQVAFDDGT